MNEVFLAGRALASALGSTLDEGLRTLARGAVTPGRFAFDGNQSWPYHAIPDAPAFQHLSEAERAQHLVRQVAADSGALAGTRRGPLFLASSSLDIAERERGQAEGDYLGYAEKVAGWLDWQGPVYTVNTACTSALNTLLSAHTLIRHGQAEQALVLGIELRNRVSIGGFGGMQLLAPTRALPLGLGRAGLVLGEAVAALYLSPSPARWRVAGGANQVDGRDPAGLVPEAVQAMCRLSLANAGLIAADIHLIKLQAAGSPGNDAAELSALRGVFDTLPPLVSLKAAIGHTLGAAGAAELALLTACLEHGVWPTVDYPLDAALGAELATRAPSHARHVLACILGFGGGHTAVVLEDTHS